MIIFCKTRYFYQSYTDMWRLIETAKFSTCYIDEIKLDQDHIYVVPTINGEFRPHIENELRRIPSKRATIIWHNLERPVEVDWNDLADKNRPVFACTKQSFDTLPGYVDQVWISDRLFAESLQNNRVKFVPMGSHPDLAGAGERSWNDFDYQYDFAHMSYINQRREPTHQTLTRLRIAPNAWPPDRDEIIRQSKCLVNIHQTDHLIGEPLRFTFAAANKIPLISETIADPYPMRPGVDYISGDISYIPQIINTFCNENVLWRSQYAESLYQLLCVEFPFHKNIEGAIQAL